MYTNVSEHYHGAINAPTRRILPRVEFYFDGDLAPPVEFTAEHIVSMALLEETSAHSDNPFGRVSSNEIDIELDNSHRHFTPTNISSPYYGKLRPGIKIVPYLGVALPLQEEQQEPDWDWVPLGIFRSGEWASPSRGVEATVVGYDKLSEIMDRTVPMLPVQVGTSVEEMFYLLFTQLGLSDEEIIIDEDQVWLIDIGWMEGNKVRDVVQNLAIAGNYSVSCDRLGGVRVRSNRRDGVPDTIMTDQDQIIDIDNPQRYTDVYSSVRVRYRSVFLDESDILFRQNNFTVPRGGTIFSDTIFTKSPAVMIEEIGLLGALNTTIDKIEYGATSFTLWLTNPNDPEEVDIYVRGLPVALSTSAYEAISESTKEKIGERVLLIDNAQIQSLPVAAEYAHHLLQLVIDPNASFTLTARGDPRVELYDIVRIMNPSDIVDDTMIFVTRQRLQYDGGLEATIEGRKMVPLDFRVESLTGTRTAVTIGSLISTFSGISATTTRAALTADVATTLTIASATTTRAALTTDVATTLTIASTTTTRAIADVGVT